MTCDKKKILHLLPRTQSVDTTNFLGQIVSRIGLRTVRHVGSIYKQHSKLDSSFLHSVNTHRPALPSCVRHLSSRVRLCLVRPLGGPKVSHKVWGVPMTNMDTSQYGHYQKIFCFDKIVRRNFYRLTFLCQDLTNLSSTSRMIGALTRSIPR